MKKIIVGVLIILILCSCILLALDRRNYISKNKKLTSEINELKNKIVEYEKEKNQEVNNDNIKTCTYTKTYRFIEYYDYMGAVPSKKFIVVDIFQEFIPIILEYDTNDFNIEFEKNAYYEITFEKNIIDGKEIKTRIKSITKTDKTGLEQIFEECEV